MFHYTPLEEECEPDEPGIDFELQDSWEKD